ncbi:unnamed protein product [Phytophthora lilii]|uniref:Unnamed protein product n=1 Tax=Phytophthora lilii TaxID=2077276 RepID=A0A9W6TM20_9STRA|nr:unnamed protein product [Phytophthora lilii]
MARPEQNESVTDTPVLEEAARPEPPSGDSNNRGNFTRNLNKEADESVAKKMFLGGLAFLPWLHLVNVIFYRKQFMDPSIDPTVTMCACSVPVSSRYTPHVSHFKDSALGCNAVSWAPFNSVGSQGPTGPIRRVVTASCDKTIKIWSLPEGETEWTKQELSSAPAHSDWVRDVAWAPSTGLPVNLIASCSEDKHVYIWSQTAEDSVWKRELLHTFDAPVWRVSWSVTGNVLAVSSGDHKVTLWKETLDKKWIQISSVDEAGAIHNGNE